MAKGQELITVNNAALIPTMDEDLAAVMADNLGNGDFNIFNLQRIRVPSGGGLAWTVDGIDGPSPEQVVSGVVISWRTWRGYWPGEFNGTGQPPQCASTDGIIGIGDPGGNCRKCQLNQFGTKNRGKACAEKRAMFLLREGDIFPHLMILPVTSAMQMNKTFMAMAQKRMSYWHVPMAFGLQQAKNTDGIVYSLVQPRVLTDNAFSPEEIEKLRAYRNQILPHIDSQSSAFVQSEEFDDGVTEDLPFE